MAKKLDTVIAFFVIGILAFTWGVQTGSSWTGNWNTISDGYIEFGQVNATQYHLDSVNMTGRLLGDWDVGISAPYFNDTSGVYLNSGSLISCYNGSWVSHGLSGDPGTTGSITLSLRGPSSYNATFIYRAPTVLASNTTHFQIEFNAWESAGWTQVPVTTVEAATVYWDATYNP